MAIRIGIDIGGTFTDLTWFDEGTGDVKVAKVPTTPADPAGGCLAAIDAIRGDATLAGADFFIHATTVGLNAILERRGAVVGLLATEGFRDILALRRGSRENPYDLAWQPRPPLVPRRRRLGIRERIASDGEVIAPLDSATVLAALARLQDEGVDAIAVCLLNAYRFPAHELAVEHLLRAAGFAGTISLSHRLSREYQEYERTSTTVVDAFVGQRMGAYLSAVSDGLAQRGFRGEAMITRSGGGAMSFGEAHERAFETIMSGPVAGVSGAAELSRMLGIDAVITADVGGTSFDTCLVSHGAPELLAGGLVDGMALQTPWVDVRTIGAGGGSIARLDEGGLLVVGPQSAGAVPGPACYGRGGTQATLTDAANMLGMLGDGRLAGGLALDRTLSQNALRPLADAFDTRELAVAQGIVRIAAASMAGAIREITVENGHDPRNMVLLAFGGAGPMMATAIAEELDLDHIIVPVHAGNFSAWGLLGAVLVRSSARTHLSRVDPAGLADVTSAAQAMFVEMRNRGGGDHDFAEEIALDMRYLGQEYALTIAVQADDLNDPDNLRDALASRYAAAFGAVPDSIPEIMCVRASLRRVLPKRTMILDRTQKPQDESVAQAFSLARGKMVEFRLINRASLAVGATVIGPAIVSEPTTTTYIDANFTLKIDEHGLMHLYRHAAESVR